MQLANRINLLISPDKAWFGRGFEGARQVMAILLILLGIASGCVSAPPAQTLTYAVSGKVRIDAPSGDQVLRFRWQQADGYFDVWFWGALGVGRTHLQGTQEALTITVPQQPVLTGPAEQLMEERLGWFLPLDAMGACWRAARRHPCRRLPVQPMRLDDWRKLFRLAGRSLLLITRKLADGGDPSG